AHEKSPRPADRQRRVRGFDAVLKGSRPLASVPRNAGVNPPRSRSSVLSSGNQPGLAARPTLPAQPPPSDLTRTRGGRALIRYPYPSAASPSPASPEAVFAPESCLRRGVGEMHAAHPELKKKRAQERQGQSRQGCQPSESEFPRRFLDVLDASFLEQ